MYELWETVTAPARWAMYVLYRDAGALSHDEIAEVDAWLADQIGPCADVESIGEQWRCDACGVLLFPDECAEYTFQRAQEPVGIQWADVMRVLRATTGTAPDADDEGMCQASAADLRAWIADLRDRVGLDTNALNAAVESYINTVR